MGGQALVVGDVGCGAGATSIAAARANPAARVTGMDLSVPLLAVAAERAAGLPNVGFVAGPVEDIIPAAGPFDLIVSRHGVMFFPDPVVGLAAMRAGTKPGGGLIFSCFRAPALNLWSSEIVAAMLDVPPPPPAFYAPGPFAFADEAFVRSVLAAAGWSDATCRAIDFTYRAGAGNDPVGDAVAFFARIGPAARVLRDAPAERRSGMLDRVAEVCTRYRNGNAVDFPAAAWLWSAENR
ncbi:class I SAM-dependent methyltransferase [Sphingomonas sp. GB1N7]|uniref:class I SAM-dependent methyltransferase n=1 Tax=Parasphingomonas caseinilytica TaxID=3096158 RepID=UPI002FC9F942